MFSNYPKMVKLKDGRSVVIHPMEKTDGEKLKKYFDTLRADDKLFMRDDVSNPAVVKKMIDDIDYEYTVPLVAVFEDEIVGVSSIHRNRHSWDSHVGHIRVSAAPKFQGTGLGYNLTREIFVIAQSMHIDIIIAEMPNIQTTAIKVFEKLGFQKAVTFKNHVKDNYGNYHDLVVMRVDVMEIMDNLLQTIREWEDKGG